MPSVPRFMVSVKRRAGQGPDLHPAEDVNDLALLLENLDIKRAREVLVGEWVDAAQKWETIRITRGWAPRAPFPARSRRAEYTDPGVIFMIPIY